MNTTEIVRLGPTGTVRYEVLNRIGKGIVVVRNIATGRVQSVNANRVRPSR